jgi:hypothetical protein
VLRCVASSFLSLLIVATFLWGGCVSCEQYFMFPGKRQPCCNKSGQCERPGKSSQRPERQDCNRLPLARSANVHPVTPPAILPAPIVAAKEPAFPALFRVIAFETLLDPSPPNLQALNSTFLI